MTSKITEMSKVFRLKSRVKYFGGHEECLEISIKIDQFGRRNEVKINVRESVLSNESLT